MKRFVCLVISLCMVFGCIGISYAADGSSGSPYYVSPTSGSFNRYYLGSSGTTYGSSSYTSWGSIFGALTQTIAQSLGQVSTNIVNKLTTLDGHIDQIESYVDGLEGYVDNLESYVDGLESKFDTANNHLNYIETYTGDAYSILGQIRTLINTISGYMPTITGYIDGIEGYIDTVESKLTSINNTLSNGISVDLGTFIPYFMPDDTFDFTDTSWTSYTTRSVVSTGFVNTVKSSSSAVVIIRDFLDSIMSNTQWIWRDGLSYVKGTDYDSADYQSIYYIDSDGTHLTLKRSLWADVRLINRYLTLLIRRTVGNDGQTYYIYDYNNQKLANTSYFSLTTYFKLLGQTMSQSIGRLAFVLANDQDIAIRDNTSSQASTLNSTFFSSSGSGKVNNSNFQDLGFASSSIKTGFASSANARDAFNGFSTSGSDGRWDWFSQNILDSLDTTTNYSKSTKSSFTNFVDVYYNEVISYAD